MVFPCNFLARFSLHPTQQHWRAVKQLLAYAKQTCERKMIITGDNFDIVAYSDSDWANDENERKSTTGALIMIGGCPVAYFSRKQKIVTLSTSEAEYVAAGECTQTLAWLTTFLGELKIQHSTPKLLIDNRSAVSKIRNPDIFRASRHIEVRFHYIRQQFRDKSIDVEAVLGELQLADIFTKALSGTRIKALLELMNIKESA